MSAKSGSLGILGGGQLAAMLTEAAHRVGVDVHIYRDADSTDRCVADHMTTAAFDDESALRRFAASVDVITIETENIPVTTLELLGQIVPVRPSPSVVAISQDRLLEKDFLTNNGITTARYGQVDSAADVVAQAETCGLPAILKTRRFGYDGKGQTRLAEGTDLIEAWERHGQTPSVLEAFVAFDFEISVIAARSVSGEISAYDPGRNDHREGILRTTEVPAQITPDAQADAMAIASTILASLDYVGVMGIEFFVADGALLVNEIAPRVHNSGHWTQQGCVVDQFEQHVRAVMGYPLGPTERHSDVVMTNLIGDDVHQPDLLQSDAERIHLYGKREARPGRKMGHKNEIRPRTTGSSTPLG